MYYSNEKLDLDNNVMDLTTDGASLSSGHNTCHPEVFNDFIHLIKEILVLYSN